MKRRADRLLVASFLLAVMLAGGRGEAFCHPAGRTLLAAAPRRVAAVSKLQTSRREILVGGIAVVVGLSRPQPQAAYAADKGKQDKKGSMQAASELKVISEALADIESEMPTLFATTSTCLPP